MIDSSQELLSRRIPTNRVYLIAIYLLIPVIGLIDYLSGYEISFSIFYLIPILLIAYQGSRLQTLLAIAFSTVIWLVADLSSGHVYSHILIPFWNATTRLGVFVLVAYFFRRLHVAMEYQKQLAQRDALTGLANTRFFLQALQQEIERAKRYRHPLTLAYIDLDNFKTINDTLGHATGDRLLQILANIFKQELRETDLVARLGGDEFAILLTETDFRTSREVLHRLLTVAKKTMQENNWPVSFSVGYITCTKQFTSPDELIRMADELMYRVKRSGKDNLIGEEYTG